MITKSKPRSGTPGGARSYGLPRDRPEREIPWQGPLYRSPLTPAIFTRFAMTARFFGWSTTFGSGCHRSLKTIRETPGRSRNLDLFRSRMSPAAESRRGFGPNLTEERLGPTQGHGCCRESRGGPAQPPGRQELCQKAAISWLTDRHPADLEGLHDPKPAGGDDAPSTWKPYFPRISANLLLMEANSSRCASVAASFSQAAILFSSPSAPANAQPCFSSSNVIPVSRSCPRPRHLPWTSIGASTSLGVKCSRVRSSACLRSQPLG
jgi:hypothetical protein